LTLVPARPRASIDNAGNPAPTAGPTRFPGRGINHEYTYDVAGGTVYIHVHRDAHGHALAAHAKPARLRVVTGTVVQGASDVIPLGSLGTYGINLTDTT